METGLFGKLPAAGDFVSRGISGQVRRGIDHWLALNIVAIAQQAQHWPYGGVRAVLRIEAMPWLLVIEPSEDAVGRAYPLVACAPLNGTDRDSGDVWADAAWTTLLKAIEKGAPADAVYNALGTIAPPAPTDKPLKAPLIWWEGSAACAPKDQLERLTQISSG